MRPLLVPLLLLGLSACTTGVIGDTVPGDSSEGGPLAGRLGVDEQIEIANLSAPVDVVRDIYGRPHIYAFTTEDAFRVQGYFVAQDRHLQLEMLRRFATGRLAEGFGDFDAALIQADIQARTFGFVRVASAQYEQMAPSERALLDAYADGVSQMFARIRSGEHALPQDLSIVDRQVFQDWTAVDVLALARSQAFSFEEVIARGLRDILDLFEATFPVGSSDPLLSKRSGIARDVLRFAPTVGTPTEEGPAAIAPPSEGSSSAAAREGSPREASTPSLPSWDRPLQALAGILGIDPRSPRGSNSWAMNGSRTESGHALLASDPHWGNTSPALFWPVAIHVEDPTLSGRSLHVSGLSFPGIPVILHGHNESVAWGSTVAGYDAADYYVEELTNDGEAVVFDGQTVPLDRVEEVIERKGGEAYTYEVLVVPHHGPILPTVGPDHTVLPPDPQQGVFSLRWMGMEPTAEFSALLGVMRSRDVDEAAVALESYEVGSQNWILADTRDNVAWTAYARVPILSSGAFAWDAEAYEGVMPCLPLPGDGTAEWVGNYSPAQMPAFHNPPEGFVASANHDVWGLTHDNDPTNQALPDGTPFYLSCRFDVGFRARRLHDRLAQVTNATPEEMASIQADHHSPLGAIMVPHLLKALSHAEALRVSKGTPDPALKALVTGPEYDPERVLQARDLLLKWRTELDCWAAVGLDLDTGAPLEGDGPETLASAATVVFNAWLAFFAQRTFADELGTLGVDIEPAPPLVYLLETPASQLATFDSATGESALWDDMSTPEVESRDERAVRALLDALAWLESTRGPDMQSYRWGDLHKIRFPPIFPVLVDMSMPPVSDSTFEDGFPRGGDMYSLDYSYHEDMLSANPDFGFRWGSTAVHRLVVQLDPDGVHAWGALSGGNVWDPASPHFGDEAELWRRNQMHAIPFTTEEVVAAAEHHTLALPAAP